VEGLSRRRRQGVSGCQKRGRRRKGAEMFGNRRCRENAQGVAKRKLWQGGTRKTSEPVKRKNPGKRERGNYEGRFRTKKTIEEGKTAGYQGDQDPLPMRSKEKVRQSRTYKRETSSRFQEGSLDKSQGGGKIKKRGGERHQRKNGYSS